MNKNLIDAYNAITQAQERLTDWHNNAEPLAEAGRLDELKIFGEIERALDTVWHLTTQLLVLSYTDSRGSTVANAIAMADALIIKTRFCRPPEQGTEK